MSDAGGIIRIPLHDRSGAVVAETVIDLDDADLAGLRWYLGKSKEGSRYVRRDWRENGLKKTEYLHRRVAKAPRGLSVDHRDRDPLNNRRKNLDLVSLGINSYRRWERRLRARQGLA